MNPDRRRWLHGALGVAGGLAVLLRSGAAWAMTVPPSSVLEAWPDARLQGAARLRVFGLSVYDARLWVRPGFDPDRFDAHPFALELTYARALKGPAIAERSLQEMARGGPVPPGPGARWLSFMREVFPDVDEGDRITGLHRPDRGAEFVVEVARAAPARRALDDVEFARRFFGIWLAPHTSEPALRARLLGRP